MTEPKEYLVSFDQIGDVFKPGDVLSEWLVTVAMAANDLALVRSWLDEEDQLTRDHPYLFGVVVSHLFEIGEYLAAWERERPIVEFIAELGSGADGYHALLDTYARRRTDLAKIRNSHTFHYGPRKPTKNPLVRQALKAVMHEPGVISVNEASATFGFASEVAAAIFTISCGGNEPGAEEVGVLLGEVAGASIDFNVFAHEAVRSFVDLAGVPAHVAATS